MTPDRRRLAAADAEDAARFSRMWAEYHDRRGRDARFPPGWWIIPGAAIGAAFWAIAIYFAGVVL